MPNRNPQQLMLDSLAGLSVGDAFGEQWFWSIEDVASRTVDDSEWKWTDDTEMALSVVHILKRWGTIDQDLLADSFARRFSPGRGYGQAMQDELLPKLRSGTSWRQCAARLFGGQGSFGNGAAMRVAPLGAFFAEDLERIVDEAELSAEVTHAHPDGIAGSIAVAVAAGVAAQDRNTHAIESSRIFLERVMPHVPREESATDFNSRLTNWDCVPRQLRPLRCLATAARWAAHDTVPFCLWMAGRYLNDFEEALWESVSVLGDMDTNCAIVAAHVGTEGIPVEWIESREPLPPLAVQRG